MAHSALMLYLLLCHQSVSTPGPPMSRVFPIIISCMLTWRTKTMALCLSSGLKAKLKAKLKNKDSTPSSQMMRLRTGQSARVVAKLHDRPRCAAPLGSHDRGADKRGSSGKLQ